MEIKEFNSKIQRNLARAHTIRNRISCIMITRQIGIRKNHSGSVSSCIIIMLKRCRSFNWSQLPATCNEFNQVPVLSPQDLDFSYTSRMFLHRESWFSRSAKTRASSFCAASSAKQMAQISPVSAQVGASTRRISPEKSQGMEHPGPHDGS